MLILIKRAVNIVYIWVLKDCI